MAKRRFLKRACDFYIRNVKLIGILYISLPVAGWIIWSLTFYEKFRPVYFARIFLSLMVGIPLSVYFNKLGLELWILKNFSSKGAGVFDGVAIGASIGMGIAFLPSLTSLIYTNNYELTKSFVIYALTLAVVFGAAMGGFLAFIGKKYLVNKKIIKEI